MNNTTKTTIFRQDRNFRLFPGAIVVMEDFGNGKGSMLSYREDSKDMLYLTGDIRVEENNGRTEFYLLTLDTIENGRMDSKLTKNMWDELRKIEEAANKENLPEKLFEITPGAAKDIVIGYDERLGRKDNSKRK